MIDIQCLREWPRTQRRWRGWIFCFKWVTLSWTCLDILIWKMLFHQVIGRLRTNWCTNIRTPEMSRKSQNWMKKPQPHPRSNLDLIPSAPQARVVHLTITSLTWGSNCTSRTNQWNTTWLKRTQLPSWCPSRLEPLQDCAWKIICWASKRSNREKWSNAVLWAERRLTRPFASKKRNWSGRRKRRTFSWVSSKKTLTSMAILNRNENV